MSDNAQTVVLQDQPELANWGFSLRDPGTVVTESGLVVYNAADPAMRRNSYLMEDEWREIDREVIRASQYPLKAIESLRTLGLVRSQSPDVMLSQWYMESGMTGATANMTGRSPGRRDVPEIEPAVSPVPVVYKDMSYPVRALNLSRRIGDGLDVSMLSGAARVVAEKLEDMLIQGDTGIVFSGATLYGLLTHPKATTDTAVNFGGGDFGTPGNAENTLLGMVNSLNTANFRGPFGVYISENQYNEISMKYHSDGTGTTPLQRILAWPSVAFVESIPAPVLADGYTLMIQAERDVVEWTEGMPVTVREWMSGNGMEVNFRVMAIAAPRVKARKNGESGIRVATGC